MLVEVCGAFGNGALFKIQFDRHKGLYGCLAMLRTLAVQYKYASLSSFENIEILFLHTKDSYLQLWSVSFTNNTFIFNRIHKCKLSLDLEMKSQTISNCIKFLLIIQEHLKKTFDFINTLSSQHTQAINDDILGVSSLNEETSLESLVRPQLHKLKKKDSGFCYENPVSGN